MKLILKISGVLFLAELLLLTIVFGLMLYQLGWTESLENFGNVFVAVISHPATHFISGLLTGVYWLMRYFKKVYRVDGRGAMLKKVSLYLLLPLGLIFSSFKALGWYKYSEEYNWQRDLSAFNLSELVSGKYVEDGKIRGVHFFARTKDVDEGLDQLVKANVEWIARVPYGYQKTISDTNLRHAQRDSLNQWTGRDSAFIVMHQKSKEKGLRTIMKPHLWMSNAGEENWRNAINFDNESDWKTWENNYRNFILHYAELAETCEMEMLCIGVEMRSTVRTREEFWRGLIKEIRQVYSGKLTYGANWWEEYKEVPFWDMLDFIGVQAYFPLSTKDNPSFDEIRGGWDDHTEELRSLSQQWNKPILFTEIGYRNTEDTATKPWEWPESIDNLLVQASVETQMHCYEAFFDTFWNKNWFAGAFFWQWRYVPNRKGNRRSFTFSPQDKPAEEVMARWFGKNSDQ